MTLADVARVAGVSAITASRSLSTPSVVAAATLARVRDAIERTGYVPNLVAGGLASNRSRLVAALVPTVAGPVFLETIQALTDALDAAGLQLMLGQSGYDGDREDRLIDAIVSRRPDGIVLAGIVRSARARRKLITAGIPVVETWDLTPTPIDMCIGFSHEAVGAAAAEFLYRRKRRRPTIVTANDQRAGLRRRGFELRWRTLAGAKEALVPCRIVPAPSSLGNGRLALGDLLAAHPCMDSVFCSSDVLAHGVLIQAQASGIAVPDRIGVVGFGDMPFAAHTHPALSTVRIDGTGIGREAAHFLIERVEGRSSEARVHDIGFSLIERVSA